METTQLAPFRSGVSRIVKASPDKIEAHLAKKKAAFHLAPGFTAHRTLDMTDHGGRKIADLAYKSFYLDGAAWAQSDIDNIDRALSGAMTDAKLNAVMAEYYTGPITTRFLGSTKVPGGVSATFDRDSVTSTVTALLNSGQLANVDFDTTVVCLFLPKGIILDTHAADGVGTERDGVDDKDSSLQGLGGYHGSTHIGARRIYFAVGVYSEQTATGANGIPVWPESWKNIVATFYHELNEARTDPDVEDAIRQNNDSLLGWYADAQGGGEIGDIPMNEATDLSLVMKEVPLVGGGTAPIQLMWANKVHGPATV